MPSYRINNIDENLYRENMLIRFGKDRAMAGPASAQYRKDKAGGGLGWGF